LPDIAPGWCHALMRLLPKYRAVTGLGDLSEDLLRLTRRIRARRDRLRHDSPDWFLAVALPEALSVSETRRLLEGVRRRGVGPGALLVSRVLVDGRLVPGTEALFARLAACDPSIPTVLGPSMRPAPVGSERLT